MRHQLMRVGFKSADFTEIDQMIAETEVNNSTVQCICVKIELPD